METIHVDSLAVPIQRQDAVIPDRAWLKCRSELWVLVRVNVTQSGKPHDAVIERGLVATDCPDSIALVAMHDAALDAARHWRWARSKERSKKVSYTVRLAFVEPADTAAFGQLVGRVVDQATRKGIPYANVIVLGTRHGAMCDAKGRFLLTLPRGRQDILTVAIEHGRHTETIAVRGGGRHEATFVMKRNPNIIVEPLNQDRPLDRRR